MYAEKIAKAGLLYVFTMAFPTSPLRTIERALDPTKNISLLIFIRENEPEFVVVPINALLVFPAPHLLKVDACIRCRYSIAKRPWLMSIDETSAVLITD